MITNRPPSSSARDQGLLRSSRARNMFRVLERISYNADDQVFPMAALIANGSQVVTMGWNRRKTHPRCSITSIRRKGIFFHGIHAELSAILSLERGYALHGHDLWVYRRCTTRPGMARPCNYCWDVILDKGIRRVIFTTGEDSSPYDLVRLY